MEDDIIWFTLSGLFLSTIVISQQGYYEPLMKDSLDFIPLLQEGTSDATQGIWGFYSTWGGNLATFLPFGIVYFFIKQRPRAYYYMFCASAIDGISAITKLNSHQERPFWVSPDVQAFHCSGQYGNPSGHSFTCLGIPLILWLDYNQKAMKEPQWKLGAWYWRAVAAVLALTFTGTIGYSRMFLGVHSLNQVLYGYSLGLWFALSVHFLVKDRLMSLIQKLVDVEETRLMRLFLLSLMLFVAAFTLQIVNYAVVNEFENPLLWRQQITEKCGADELNGAFQARGLLDFAQDSAIWGCFWGILLQQKVTPGIVSGELDEEGWLRAFLRAGVTVLVFLPAFILAIAVDKAAELAPWGNMLLVSVVPALYGGIAVFFLADWANLKLGLLKMKKSQSLSGASCQSLQRRDTYGSEPLTISPSSQVSI